MGRGRETLRIRRIGSPESPCPRQDERTIAGCLPTTFARPYTQCDRLGCCYTTKTFRLCEPNNLRYRTHDAAKLWLRTYLLERSWCKYLRDFMTVDVLRFCCGLVPVEDFRTNCFVLLHFTHNRNIFFQ